MIEGHASECAGGFGCRCGALPIADAEPDISWPTRRVLAWAVLAAATAVLLAGLAWPR